MLSHVYRIIRGLEVNEETLGFDAIRDAVTGEGHFLGHTHTMAAMQRDYFYPTLGDREAPVTWAEQGATDLRTRARTRVRAVLDSHYPNHIEQALDRRIRDRYRILLPPERMRPRP